MIGAELFAERELLIGGSKQRPTFWTRWDIDNELTPEVFLLCEQNPRTGAE